MDEAVRFSLYRGTEAPYTLSEGEGQEKRQRGGAHSLQGAPAASSNRRRVTQKILLGLSCGRYRECCEAIPEAFSLSPSTVSRRFIRASTRKLKELMERRLDELDIVAIVIDGKSFKDDEMIVALGVTEEGKKVLLALSR